MCVHKNVCQLHLIPNVYPGRLALANLVSSPCPLSLQEKSPCCQYLSGSTKLCPKVSMWLLSKVPKWSWSPFRKTEKPFYHNTVPHFGSQPPKASIIVVKFS